VRNSTALYTRWEVSGPITTFSSSIEGKTLAFHGLPRIILKKK
jgi:hypothetical protein